tara:strand:- start:766 stop:945 length:180 start_codon:yes stop_codon:yes gene_type:complete
MFILKMLTPKVLKAIMSYVFEKNDLDKKMDLVEVRLSRLELDAHPKCCNCKKKIKKGVK